MSWYTTGTVSVTNNSTTVTGVGTAFVANVIPGEEFRIQGEAGFEVEGVISDTQLTLARAYVGSSKSAQSYEIVPVRGYKRTAYDSIQQVLAQWTTYLDGPLAGRFADGSAGAPGISNAGDTNTGLFFPAGDQLAASTNGLQRLLLSAAAMKLDVPLTGSAVQSSTTDATAGKVLTVGAFGLGGSAPNIGNASVTDNSIAPGFYEYSTGGGDTGGPSGVVFGTIIHIRRGTGGGETQMLVAEGPTSLSGSMFSRSRTTGDWEPWRGIEYGSNVNGSYTRLPNGTQICTQVYDHSALAFTASGGLDRSASLTPNNWPAAFDAASSVDVTSDFRGTNSTVIWGASAGATTLAAPCDSYRFTRGSGSGSPDCRATFIGKGRWY